MLFPILMAAAASASPFYSFSVRDIDGKPYDMSRLRGQVVLVVNTASKCGFTPQYAGLQKLHEIYGARGLTILGFPANDFLNQEPGSNGEIKEFCALKYGVGFTMMEKTSVVEGDRQHPLYRWLTAHPNIDGEIKWTFEKILVGRDGVPLQRFRSRVEPLDERLTRAIEAALAAPAPVTR